MVRGWASTGARLTVDTDGIGKPMQSQKQSSAAVYRITRLLTGFDG